MTVEAPQNTPFYRDSSPDTCFRICDETMVAWLSGMRFRSQVPAVSTAWKSRKFAQEHEMDSKVPEKQARRLPHIVLFKTSIMPSLSRRQVNRVSVLRPGARSTETRMYVDSEGNQIYELPYPLPFDLHYQVDIFTKTQEDMQRLRTEILSRMTYVDETFLCAEFPRYGQKLLPLKFQSLNDTSDLETGEEERSLRNTLNFVMEAWIFRIPVIKKTAQKASIVIIDASKPEENNLDDGSDFLAHYLDDAHYSLDGNGFITDVEESDDFAPPNRVLAWYNFDNGTLESVGP